MQFDMANRNNSAPQKSAVLGRMAWLMFVALLPAAVHGAENQAASSVGSASSTNIESGEAAGNKAGKCVAHICLGTPITQKDIVAKYGPGREHVSGGKPLETVTRCYYDPKQGLYIEFSFDKHLQEETVYHSDLAGIMVSRVAMCPKSFKPKQPFPKFETEYGLAIGSTDAEVRAAMGKPDRARDMGEVERNRSAHHSTHQEMVRTYDAADYGETALFYNPDPQHNLLFNYFYLSQGKVKSIYLNASE